MRPEMTMTKNLLRFYHSVDELLNRPKGTEGMEVLYGFPGEGKSSALSWVCNKYDGIYVRAKGCWTVTSMLFDLCKALEYPSDKRMLRRADMVDYIVKELIKPSRPLRPIFIDEADYCLRQIEMIDSLRDIYDMSSCPVILVGMEDFARRCKAHDRLARRITQWIEFNGLDLEDTKLVAKTCCEVELADDLVTHLHKETGANIGRIIIGLTKIEHFAKTNGITIIDLSQWGDRPLYFDQPTFGRKKS